MQEKFVQSAEQRLGRVYFLLQYEHLLVRRVFRLRQESVLKLGTKAMNKSVSRIVAAVLTALAVRFADAAQDDALLAFSTRGPDRYADGTSVLEGEVYALVWVRNGFEFKGVDMNGAAVDAENTVQGSVPLISKDIVVHFSSFSVPLIGETRSSSPR